MGKRKVNSKTREKMLSLIDPLSWNWKTDEKSKEKNPCDAEKGLKNFFLTQFREKLGGSTSLKI